MGDNRKGRLGEATRWGITGVKEAERMEKYGSGNVWAENWNEGEDGERRGGVIKGVTAQQGEGLSRGAPVDCNAQTIHTKVCFHRWDCSNFPAEHLFNSNPHLFSSLKRQLRKVLADLQPNINAVTSPQADMPSYSKCYVISLVWFLPALLRWRCYLFFLRN